MQAGKKTANNLLNIDNYYIDISLWTNRNDTLNGIGNGVLVYRTDLIFYPTTATTTPFTNTVFFFLDM